MLNENDNLNMFHGSNLKYNSYTMFDVGVGFKEFYMLRQYP